MENLPKNKFRMLASLLGSVTLTVCTAKGDYYQTSETILSVERNTHRSI